MDELGQLLATVREHLAAAQALLLKGAKDHPAHESALDEVQSSVNGALDVLDGVGS